MQARFLKWIKSQLDLNSTMPLYRQLQQAIESAIEHQIVDAGDFLPAERHLAQQLNLSRVTISKAMQALEKKGVVIRQQGVGTQIAKYLGYSLSHESGFTSQVIKAGGTVTTQWLLRTLTEAPADIAAKLGLSVGAQIAQLRRIRIANGQPVSFENNYIPSQYLPEPAKLTDSLYALWESQGITFSQVQHKVKAISCNEEQANWLNSTVGAPLLFVRQTSTSKSGVIIEYSEIICRGDIYELEFNSP
ncbi:GntR family transcriptional regulator [Providencia manganoxydans]|uniref:GntR family transcriptional regulator n=1 Tax=Providencia manganoxydans TaxID=2923283 RepID=UPI00280E8986|nr:GntR family transcriptional regulator [Providencia stuartii]ELR5082613.1 GntR family transcriptional regulator [Providencia stuartii]